MSGVLEYAPIQELETIRARKRNRMKMNILVSSSPHHFISFMRIIYRLPISGKQQRFAKWKIYWSDPLKIVF